MVTADSSLIASSRVRSTSSVMGSTAGPAGSLASTAVPAMSAHLHDEVVASVHVCSPTGRYPHRGVGAVDEGGPRERGARPEVRAGVHVDRARRVVARDAHLT